MELAIALLGISLAVSAAWNVILLAKDRKPQKRLDVSASDLLHELTTRGQALVRIEYLDPESILIRRPGS